MKYVYIREIYANQAVRDYTLPLGESQRGTLGKIHIIANRQDNIIKVEINDRELSLNNPETKVNLNSAGRVIPIKLTYSNGNVRTISMNFQSNNPQQTPIASTNSAITPAPTPATPSVGCFRHPQLGNVKEQGCTGSCDGSGCGLMGYYVCTVSGEVSTSFAGSACSDRCQRCNNPVTIQDAPLCNEQRVCAPIKLQAQSDGGWVVFRWDMRNEDFSYFQIRIDDTIDPWQGSTKDGDIVENNIQFDRLYGRHYVTRCIPGHTYKWWAHTVYGNSPASPAAIGNEFVCK